MKESRNRAHENEERTKKKPGGQQHQNHLGRLAPTIPNAIPATRRVEVEPNRSTDERI